MSRGRRQKDPDRAAAAGLLLTLCLAALSPGSQGLNIVQQRQLAMRGCSYALAGMASAASSYPFKTLRAQRGGAHAAVRAVANIVAEGGVSHNDNKMSSSAALGAGVAGAQDALVAAAAATAVAATATSIFSAADLRARNPLQRLRRPRIRGGGGAAPLPSAAPLSPAVPESDAAVAQRAEVSAAVCAATTVAAVSAVVRDLAGTGLTKAVTLTSYDQIFGRVRACKPGGALLGFPAVFLAAAGTGIVASIISQNAPARRRAAGGGRGRARLQPAVKDRAARDAFMRNMAKEMLGYAAFFGIYHAVFILLPQCGYSTFGQAAGGATASLLSSYIPTDYSKWRIPTKMMVAPDGLACATQVPPSVMTVAQAMEKAETFVRTAAFCGVSYAVGMRLGI